jgi:hypothetical protein
VYDRIAGNLLDGGDVLDDDDEIDSAKWLPSLRASSCCSMWSSVARGWRTAQ